MRYLLMVLSFFMVITVSSCSGNARPDHVGVSVGINVPVFPRLVLVPGYPVYYDPSISLNYFFYDGLYWVYISDRWYASSWYNGPWGVVEHRYVPMYVLRVPVRYYRQPPAYFRGWRADAPPRWDERWGRDWDKDRDDRFDADDRGGRGRVDDRGDRDRGQVNGRDDRGDRDRGQVNGRDDRGEYGIGDRGQSNDRNDRGQQSSGDRRRVPDPAPVPSYQRDYSGERYPRDSNRQDDIRSQNYRYEPREPITQERFKQQGRGRGNANDKGGDRGGDRQNNGR